MKQHFLKKVGAWLLAVCMLASMIPTAFAATPPANGMVISSQDAYAKYGGPATVHFLFEIDTQGSAGYTATAGGLFQLTSTDPNLLPSLRTSNFSCINPVTKNAWSIQYAETNGRIFPTALDLTSTAFDVSMNIEKVTTATTLDIEAVERYGGVMIDAVKDGKGIQLSKNDVSVISMPTVRLVYDLTVEPQANGSISYPAKTFNATDSTMSAAANKTVEAGKSETSQTGTGEATTFTLTPAAGYMVDHLEITTPSGTQNVAASEMTSAAGGAKTYNFAGLTSLTSETDKATVKGFFKADDGTVAEEYGVTYDVNGGTMDPLVADTGLYATGATVTVKYPTGTATGLTATPVFAGWKDAAGGNHHTAYTSKDNTTTIPAVGETVAMVKDGLKLTAIWSTDTNDNSIPDIWETSGKVKLTFNTNGGSSIEPQEFDANTAVDLSKYSSDEDTEAAYKVTKAGYSFKGFYISQADATTAESTKDYAKKLTSLTIKEDTTVYAAWEAVLITDHIRYLQGYTNGTFMPKKSMTRAEVAQMFYNLLSDKTENGTSTYTDVPSNAWYAAAVKVLASKGIIKGYADGTFKPSSSITRAEFATIASRFAELKTGTKTFSDVPASHWAHDAIISSATYGWVDGYPDGTFRPNQPITRSEVVKITNAVRTQIPDSAYITAHLAELKTFSDVVSSDWAYNEILEATNGHTYTQAGTAPDITETWTGVSQ